MRFHDFILGFAVAVTISLSASVLIGYLKRKRRDALIEDMQAAFDTVEAGHASLVHFQGLQSTLVELKNKHIESLYALADKQDECRLALIDWIHVHGVEVPLHLMTKPEIEKRQQTEETELTTSLMSLLTRDGQTFTTTPQPQPPQRLLVMEAHENPALENAGKPTAEQKSSHSGDDR